MNRRKLVSIAGTAGLASLAGCQALGGKLSRDGPEFESVDVSGPSEVEVGESLSLSVSVTNAGGRSGDFADALTVPDALDSDAEIRIRDVPASESRTVEVGPYAFDRAGDYRFRLAESGAVHEVSVGTRALSGGEQFAFADGLAVAASDPSAHASLFYDAPDGRGLLSPDDGSVLAVVHVSMENRSERELRTGPGSFDVAGGEVVADLGREDGSLADVADLDGDPFPDGSIAPGETQTGWLLAEVTREQVAAGLRVEWKRDRDESVGTDGAGRTTSRIGAGGTTSRTGTDETTSRPETDEASSRTEVDETTDGRTDAAPDVRWTFDGATPPRFEVTNLTVWGEAELGSRVAATATVANTGSTSATYRGALERRDGDETDWNRAKTFERVVAPGSSTTWATEVETSAVGPTRYRLRPGSAASTVDVAPARRALGEPFTTPRGVTVRAEVGTSYFEGLLPSYIYEDLNTQTVRAESGYTFAFVRVSVENENAEPAAVPDQRVFSVVVDGEQYSAFHVSSSDDVTFRSPIDGPWYDPTAASEPGATHSGWLVFRVPDGVAVEDLGVRCSPNDDVTVTWSGEP